MGGRGVGVGELAVFMSRGCVLLGVVVLAHVVVVGRLMVVMRGGLMVGGCLMVRVCRRMFW